MATPTQPLALSKLWFFIQLMPLFFLAPLWLFHHEAPYLLFFTNMFGLSYVRSHQAMTIYNCYNKQHHRLQTSGNAMPQFNDSWKLPVEQNQNLYPSRNQIGFQSLFHKPPANPTSPAQMFPPPSQSPPPPPRPSKVAQTRPADPHAARVRPPQVPIVAPEVNGDAEVNAPALDMYIIDSGRAHGSMFDNSDVIAILDKEQKFRHETSGLD